MEDQTNKARKMPSLFLSFFGKYQWLLRWKLPEAQSFIITYANTSLCASLNANERMQNSFHLFFFLFETVWGWCVWKRKRWIECVCERDSERKCKRVWKSVWESVWVWKGTFVQLLATTIYSVSTEIYLLPFLMHRNSVCFFPLCLI